MNPSREPGARTGGSAGRVIAGVARGRRLASPGTGTRPLSDRVKQSLFAIIEPEIRGRSFLDLFAGSGAGGIEALSRGAAAAVFVERDRAAARYIERNLRTAALLGSRATIVSRDAIGWLRKRDAGAEAFAAILVDPPYDRPELLRAVLDGITDAGPGAVLAADGVVVAKHFWKQPPAPNRLLRSVREERFGDTQLTFYRWAGIPGAGEEDG